MSPVASMPGSGPAQLMGQSSATDLMEEERRLHLIRRTALICGHVVFATMGLACGYWILGWLRPEAIMLGIFR